VKGRDGELEAFGRERRREVGKDKEVRQTFRTDCSLLEEESDI